MIQEFKKIESVNGEINLPGDKSISHRALIFSALANGTSVIKNLSNAIDVRSTLNCFEQLGIKYQSVANELKIFGIGYGNLKSPNNSLNAGNSGTTARLLTGILSVQNFDSQIIGDQSLSKRPMKRVIEPLQLMGGKFSSNDFKLPLKIFANSTPRSIVYELKIPSAQVKSAILLAGVHLDEETCVIENDVIRNHTELMLDLKIEERENQRLIYSSKKDYPKSAEYFTPSDISSASFLIVLALLTKNSTLVIRNVSLNKTRTGLLEHLIKMGAKIKYENINSSMQETYGDLIVESSYLKNIPIDKNQIPNLIDEIPALSIAGFFAEGYFEVRNAKELRVKESDRISSIVKNFKLLGVEIEEYEDGFAIIGKEILNLVLLESYDDHRIAMAFGILFSLLKDGGKINNFETVNISNPNFINQLESVAR